MFGSGKEFPGSIKTIQDYPNPYLIQRGTFKKIPPEEIRGLDSLIDYDYMGSSEFEFGALPFSLTQICKAWSSFTVVQIPEIKDVDHQYSYLICHKDLVDVIKPIILKLFSVSQSYQLKERSDCYSYVTGNYRSYIRTNFWWDIDNHWMCCFGNNVRSLVTALQLVCRKKDIDPSDGPKTPQRVDYPVTFSMEHDGDKVTVCDYRDKVTEIALRKAVEIVEEDKELTVFVFCGKIGNRKKIILNIPKEPKRDALVRVLSEYVQRNNGINKRITT